MFKYANFLVDNLNVAPGLALGLRPIALAPVHLPLGISFFTFQALSYVVDVYRRDVAAQRSLLDFALYKTLFPQLIAGPIVRYRDVAGELSRAARDPRGVRRGHPAVHPRPGQEDAPGQPAGGGGRRHLRHARPTA